MPEQPQFVQSKPKCYVLRPGGPGWKTQVFSKNNELIGQSFDYDAICREYVQLGYEVIPISSRASIGICEVADAFIAAEKVGRDYKVLYEDLKRRLQVIGSILESDKRAEYELQNGKIEPGMRDLLKKACYGNVKEQAHGKTTGL